MMMDGNETYCGYHFVVYTIIKLLSYTPEVNMIYINFTPIKMLHTNFTSMKKKEHYQ